MKLIVFVACFLGACLLTALTLNVFPELTTFKEIVGVGCGLLCGRASKVSC